MSLTRRDSVKWLMAAMLAAPAAPALTQTALAQTAGDNWPKLPGLMPGEAYGTDPDMMNPKVTWPLLLTPAQKAQLSVLGDLILPADDTSRGAGEAGIADFFDEWLSAPYPDQSHDRDLILPGLAWLDSQAGGSFAAAPVAVQRGILDRLSAAVPGSDPRPVAFFDRLRVLNLVGFYTAPDGLTALGFQGNTPIIGDFPGPSEEALAHFNALCASLGLKA